MFVLPLVRALLILLIKCASLSVSLISFALLDPLKSARTKWRKFLVRTRSAADDKRLRTQPFALFTKQTKRTLLYVSVWEPIKTLRCVFFAKRLFSRAPEVQIEVKRQFWENCRLMSGFSAHALRICCTHRLKAALVFSLSFPLLSFVLGAFHYAAAAALAAAWTPERYLNEHSGNNVVPAVHWNSIRFISLFRNIVFRLVSLFQYPAVSWQPIWRATRDKQLFGGAGALSKVFEIASSDFSLG